jgi:lipoprotein-releasing system ATP-binding protein
MILKAEHLSKTYNDSCILKDVSIEINEGEIVAITGPSGAGKTTLLNLLSGLDAPDINSSSRLQFLDLNLLESTAKQIALYRNRYMGFVFQFHGLLDEFTALENVMLPGIIGGVKPVILKKNAEQLLRRMQLTSNAAQKPSTLSGGEGQRVAIARALIQSPKIIFADEPSGNLDPQNAFKLFELFEELRSDFNCAFVMVTHDATLAKKANRIVEMVNGELV